MLGPPIEPHLSPYQAAKQGGSCGTNVQLVHGHLSPRLQPGRGRPLATRIPEQVRDATLGPISRAVRVVAALADAPGTRDGRAVLFSDQAKAFKQIGHGWVELFLRGWQVPHLVLASLLP